ncbi:MAG: deoxyribodipyrimidine photo-lyase [Litorimonas sp.]
MPTSDPLQSCPDALKVRCRTLNERDPNPEADYVLCWLQQALRGRDNPALDVAIALANARSLPVLVYHGIGMAYPHASDRLHRFLLGASAMLRRQCKERGLACVNFLQRPDKVEKGLVYRLAKRAALVVTDDQPTFVGRWQADRFSAGTERLVVAVDANRLVPYQALPEDLGSTRAFRAAAKALREDYGEPDDIAPEHPPYDGPVCFEPDDPTAWSDAEVDALIRACPIDHSLPPGAFEASRAAIDTRLDRLKREVLPVYKYRRNNPADPNSASHLSPYLHFGMIGPREIFQIVQRADAPAGCKWKYLDELLTWREWFWYLADGRSHPASYDNVPAAARASLNAHRHDPRPALYDLAQLTRGETDDPIWNAAQRQYLLDGYMHNNLRMYWVKQIIKWTPDPETAWATACHLNDRLSYDGRDPATYGNMEWGFGRSRPYAERPVYGTVPYKTDRALRKRPGVMEWVEAMNARPLPDVAIPDLAERASMYGVELDE